MLTESNLRKCARRTNILLFLALFFAGLSAWSLAQEAAPGFVLPDPDPIPPELSAKLQSKDPSARFEGLKQLVNGHFDEDFVEPTLIYFLGDDYPAVRQYSEDVLISRASWNGEYETLVKAIGDTRVEIRQHVATIIERVSRSEKGCAFGKFQFHGCDDGEVISALVGVLGDPDPEVRRRVKNALKGFGPDEIPSSLLEALMESDSTLAWEAASDLGLTIPDDPGSLTILIGDLQSSESAIASYAAIALGKLGARAKSAIKPLKDAYKKHYDDALGDIGTFTDGITFPEAIAHALVAIAADLHENGDLSPADFQNAVPELQKAHKTYAAKLATILKTPVPSKPLPPQPIKPEPEKSPDIWSTILSQPPAAHVASAVIGTLGLIVGSLITVYSQNRRRES